MKLAGLVRYSVAGILMVAAVLKIIGLAYNVVPGHGWMSHSAIQSSAVIIELILGVWLISGRTKSVAWLFATLLFMLFAIVSFVSSYQGLPSCNCFGSISLNPIWVCLFDAGIVAALLLVRPSRADVASEVAQYGLPAAYTALAFLTISILWYVTDADQYYNRIVLGKILHVESAVDFGEVEPKSIVTESIVVHNSGQQPVTIVGGTSTCSCIVSETPVSLSPGESGSVNLTIKVPSEFQGQVYYNIELWTDYSRQPRLPVRVGFTVQ